MKYFGFIDVNRTVINNSATNPVEFQDSNTVYDRYYPKTLASLQAVYCLIINNLPASLQKG